VADLVAGVGVALGRTSVTSCASLDRDVNGIVSIDELVAGVSSAVHGCEQRAFVVASDFFSGAFGAVSLDDQEALFRADRNHLIHRDAVARTYGDLVYVVNRLFADNIEVIDPNDDFRTIQQCSTGQGTNPHDIAFASTDRAYVTLYERAELLIVDPSPGEGCDGFILGSIDLSEFADGDGIPDMDQMVIVENRLYVSLQHLDLDTVLRLPAGPGAIAVIDLATDQPIDVIGLTGENPLAATKGLTVHGGAIVVSEIGEFGALDGGIERVDLLTHEAEGFVVTEEDLGGDITDFVFISDRLAYAIVAEPDFETSLVAFDPGTRQVTRTLRTGEGFTMSDIELNDRGEIYLADRARSAPGIRIFRAVDGTEMTSGVIDLFLPPVEIVFVR
jgi:hypothetical protein